MIWGKIKYYLGSISEKNVLTDYALEKGREADQTKHYDNKNNRKIPMYICMTHGRENTGLFFSLTQILHDSLKKMNERVVNDLINFSKNAVSVLFQTLVYFFFF